MTSYDALSAAQARYADLVNRLNRGELDQATFQQAQMQCVVQDAYGRSWMPSPQSGQWYLWDGRQWVLQALPPQPEAAPAPPPVQQNAPHRGRAGARQPAAGQQVIVIQERGHRRFGCGGCLLVMLALLVVVAGVGVWLSPLPEKWGLRKSVAERELGPLDDEAAAEVRFAFEDEGTPTAGMLFYVLPYQDGSGQVLYVIADLSWTLDGTFFGGAVPSGDIVALMTRLAQCKAVRAQQITRIGLEYHNREGAQVALMTARTEDLLALAEGRISRKELLKVLDGQYNFKALTEGVK